MQTKTQVKLAIVEPDPLVREGLCLTLGAQPGIDVGQCVASPDDIATGAGDTNAILFSCRYPSDIFGEGLMLEYSRLRYPGIRLIVLTYARARAPIALMAAAGIDGYVIRHAAGVVELARVIRGEQRFCALSTEILRNAAPEQNLTLREMQIAQALHTAGDLTRRVLAQRLQISKHTFNVHVRNILQKVEAVNERQLIDRCVELGWLADK